MNSGRLLGAVAALALAGLVVGEIATSGGGSSTGRAAPELPKEVLSGPAVTIDSLRGKPAVVNFWASWCAPCEREAPELERLQRHLGSRVRLVGVDWGDSASNARRFIHEHGLTYPVLRDETNAVGNDYGLRGLPTTFVLDSDGRIARVLPGPQTESSILAALPRTS